MDVVQAYRAQADLLDEDGRPVGEIGSLRYDPESTELSGCPFAGSRRGRPMNRTALRQLATVFPDVLRAASAVAGPRATVYRAWWTSLAGTIAPAVFVRIFPGPVPRVLSAWYKASLGFSQVLTGVLLAADGIGALPLRELGTAEPFVDLLERDGWLVGEEQVCAGPPDWIAALFDALADAPPDVLAPAELAALGEPSRWVQPHVDAIVATVSEQLAARDRTARGDSGLPWLRTVFAVPGRTSAHAARLHPPPNTTMG